MQPANGTWYVPFDQIKPLPLPEGGYAKYMWQSYPIMEYFVTPYERNWMGGYDAVQFWKAQWYAPFAGTVVYLGGIYLGQKMMANRKPFDLRGPLAYWNLFLSIFSWMGAIRTVPYALWWLSTIGLKALNCTNSRLTMGERDVGLWVTLFLVSKLLEFFDTAFIILRKKPLIFLHWYHHITVAVYCYYAGVHTVPGLIFVAMNYTVHAVMYGYFYLSAAGRVPKWFNPMWITAMQIAQMIIGAYVGTMQAVLTLRGECEDGHKGVSTGALIMYASYLYLFLSFFVDRFFLAPRRKAASQKKRQQEDKTAKAQ